MSDFWNDLSKNFEYLEKTITDCKEENEILKKKLEISKFNI
jgi:hypothetical protein